jgi:hypothetical protein
MQTLTKLAAGIAAVTALSACGGTSSTPSGGGAATASSPAGVADVASGSGSASRARDTGATDVTRHARRAAKQHARAARSGPDPVSRDTRPARPSGRDAESETRSSGRSGINPCTLMTRSEAQGILGGTVAKPQLGLQGPTCIYQTRRIKQPITLTLQHVPLATAARLGRNVIHTDVSGRKAVCVSDGGVRLLVPLSTSSVLTVGGPCPIAAHVAETALRRLR